MRRFFFMYVYRCISVQNMLDTLKRHNPTIVFKFFIHKKIKQTWRKIANKSIKSWGQNTGWKEQLTMHFYCVIRISLQSIQLTEIDARNESESFTRKVSFSWRRHLEGCRNLSRRIIRLVSTRRAKSTVNLSIAVKLSNLDCLSR